MAECELCEKGKGEKKNQPIFFILDDEQIVCFWNSHTKPPYDNFEVMQNLLLSEAKKKWESYDFVKDTKRYGDHYSLIIRKNILEVENKLDNTFCPLINKKCEGKKCLYHDVTTIRVDNVYTEVYDCLKRMKILEEIDKRNDFPGINPSE